MHWSEPQHIFDPRQHRDWAGSHAQVPTPLLYDNFVRIFYADRNENGKSFTTYIDVDRGDLSKVIYHHKEPILDFGQPGTFDDDGVMPSFAIRHGGRLLLYYSGWNRGVTIPYRNSVGLAVSDDDGQTFRRLYEGPVLERCATEPHIAVTPSILIEDGLWRMWYISGLRWELVNGKYEPVYVIKYCHSKDGIAWERPNIQCIPQSYDSEAFSHPTVIRDGDVYRMWYCFRGSQDYRGGKNAYRIGYAESSDGIDWARCDDVLGIPHSDAEWASTMTCYPYAIEIDGEICLFYNGNDFGRTGIGVVKLRRP
jgi:hypothetical protein